jgi:hypothetical protein
MAGKSPGQMTSERNDLIFESSFRFDLLFEHDLGRKPVSTFRDHAWISEAQIFMASLVSATPPW